MIEEGKEWEVHRKTRLHRRLAASQAKKNNLNQHQRDHGGQKTGIA
jgi:hypothetical protein